jgi:cytochrome c oxidase cbb3-type subunit 2
MFESKSGVFLIAGLGFFGLAFLANGVVPILMYAHLPEKSVEQMIEDQSGRSYNIMTVFKDLSVKYKEPFAKHIGEPTKDNLAATLREGRTTYIAEGCWHCHSQFVRPVSNEETRWGPVSQSWEYQNELQRPVMFGTRRIGPDLTREGGRRSSDWHATHFFKPKWTSPQSVMPEYPWLFDGDPGKPNRRGLAMITYVQWLGSWADTYPYINRAPALGTQGTQP